MLKVNVAIIASSNKRCHNGDYGRCVAGITENGEWIRLVADVSGDSLTDALAPECVRVIEAEVEYAPLENQPENAVLIRYKPIDDDINTYFKLIEPSTEQYIFGNLSNRLSESEMKRVNGSLRFVEVKELEVYKTDKSWKVKFKYNGNSYVDIAMTDPAHYRAGQVGDAWVVISLPNSDGGYSGYYKFVAAIYPKQ